MTSPLIAPRRFVALLPFVLFACGGRVDGAASDGGGNGGVGGPYGIRVTTGNGGTLGFGGGGTSANGGSFAIGGTTASCSDLAAAALVNFNNIAGVNTPCKADYECAITCFTESCYSGCGVAAVTANFDATVFSSFCEAYDASGCLPEGSPQKPRVGQEFLPS
jgi:hypothetical protein